VAFADKASSQNERTLIGIESGAGKVLFKQIAGAVARRIVAEIEIGQSAVLGAPFGMIKFGPRVDVIMPRQAVLKVAMHDRVVGGETVLASLA
jgi:phosphatidylserine decarboxylase